MFSISQAINDFAWNHGQTVPEQAWLLHDFDIWLANPHYTGPKVPHPEDDTIYDEVHAQELDVRLDPHLTEIPF